MVAALLGLAVIAHAAISSVQPSTGQGEPGTSVSAVVNVNTNGLTSCLTATADTTLVITFDGLTTACGTGTWSAVMEVAIPAVTPPGNYTVTISEVTLIGGSLLGSQTWPLQVTAPATTTTLLPEITIFPTTTTTTTTTTAPTTTTTAPSTTTTSAGATPGTTTPTSPGSSTVAPEAATTNEPGSLTYSPPATSPPLSNGPSTSLPESASAPTPEATGAGPETPFSEIAVSSGLIDMADRALPPVFAQAILSPLVILEVLVRALGRTGNGLLIPLGVTILAGFALARRLRRDVEELPELDEIVEIPDEEGDGR